MKPLLIITGFLGAGKTSLLRDLTSRFHRHGFRCDVILNDFADAEIDAATVDGVAYSVAPIAASCACCESLEDLMELCRLAASGDGEILLIELNGTADPLTLLESFTMIEKQFPFFPRLQVCVVDARHWGRRGNLDPLEKRQLESAAFCQLTHVDEVEESRVKEVETEIRAFAPYCQLVTSERLQGMLQEEVTSESEHRSSDEDSLDDSAVNSSREDSVHQISHRFSGHQVRLPSRVRKDAIRNLLSDLPPWVLRAKALVKLVEEPGCRWLFERVGSEPISSPLPVSSIRNTSSSLICIGAQMNPGEIDQLVGKRFGIEVGGSS